MLQHYPANPFPILRIRSYFCSMHVLLCAATRFELQDTQRFLQAPLLPQNFRVQLLCTGVGLLATTYQLTQALTRHQPDLVIQAGIGGSLDEQLSLCETVVIRSDTVADAGVMENNQFTTLFDLHLLNPHEAPWSAGVLVNPHTDWIEKTGLQTATGITVNEITTSAGRIQVYKSRMQAQIESLEGAALHYVCLQQQVPFLQIRTVSNYIGERNKEKWKLHESIAQLNQELQQVLIKIMEA